MADPRSPEKNSTRASGGARTTTSTNSVGNKSIMTRHVVTILLSIAVLLQVIINGVVTTSDLSKMYQVSSEALDHFVLPQNENASLSPSLQAYQMSSEALDHFVLPQNENASLSPSLQAQPFQVIHTVLTRFMVGQPSFPILARARFKLFQAFCYPSMRYQTSQNFYWVVLAEAKMDPEILQEMAEMLQPMPNAYLVLTSNTSWISDGYGVEGEKGYGVDLQEIADEFRAGTTNVTTGDLDKLRSFDYLQMTGKPILRLDTTLDADDGLHHHGVEMMHDMAIDFASRQRTFLRESRNITWLNLNNSWWNFCGHDHWEWHNRDIYMLSPGEYQAKGIGSGLIGLRREPVWCASAGTTRAGSISLPIHSPPEFPPEGARNHAHVLGRNPVCDEVVNFTNCGVRKFPSFPFVLRARVSSMILL